jgi:hypothetical protein
MFRGWTPALSAARRRHITALMDHSRLHTRKPLPMTTFHMLPPVIPRTSSPTPAMS